MGIIEKQWKEFVTQAYGDLPETTEQYRAMKAVWYSAYLDCNIEIHEMIKSERTTEEKVDFVEAMNQEASEFIDQHIREEARRQGVTLPNDHN
jgi:hypothetical protein